MSIIFNNIVFRLDGGRSFGNREPDLPEKNCFRCGHTAWQEKGEYQSEYNVQSYIWYQSLDGETYLCMLCVDMIQSPPIRKCVHCNKQFTTGKQIITHLKANHPK